MTKKEWNQIQDEQRNMYAGILFHNQSFAQGNEKAEIRYHFNCPEFTVLKEKYGLEQIAGKGGDFVRAKRLLHYLAPRLTHCSWYDNHIPCNALDLLAYSLNNPEQGINCRNKSKILEECCLALGIYARRVWIMPYSPYDFDNHVVTEIYDRKLQKWIMLDATSDGYFVDENKMPLCLLELREKFANDCFTTFVSSTDGLKNLEKRKVKYAYINTYICKNLFYFQVGAESRFGEPEKYLIICPEHYSIRDNRIGNVRFRIRHMPEEYRDVVPKLEDNLKALAASEETVLSSVDVLRKAPIQ